MNRRNKETHFMQIELAAKCLLAHVIQERSNEIESSSLHVNVFVNVSGSFETQHTHKITLMQNNYLVTA